MTGAFLGSPEYVAPEAIEGKLIDARSDLYSLGVIFYETPHRPPAVQRGHALRRPAQAPDRGPLPRPRSIPRAAPALERIVLRLLDKHATSGTRGRGARAGAARLPEPRRPDQRRGRSFFRASGRSRTCRWCQQRPADDLRRAPRGTERDGARSPQRAATARGDLVGQDVLEVLESAVPRERRVVAEQRPVCGLQGLAVHGRGEQREHVGQPALGGSLAPAQPRRAGAVLDAPRPRPALHDPRGRPSPARAAPRRTRPFPRDGAARARAG
jgi:hypothetical protein